MTRSEFVEGIISWDELKEFCSEIECYLLDEIFDEDSMDSEINDFIREDGYRYNWYELRDCLKDTPTGYQFYRENSTLDWDGLTDDDFEDYKDDVLIWAEDNEIFDEEELDDEERENDESESVEQETVDEPEDPPVEDEVFSFDELFGLCAQVCSSIQENNRHQKEVEYAEFENFVKCG